MLSTAVLACVLLGQAGGQAPPLHLDEVGEALIRRTDPGAMANIESPPRTKPDILGFQCGNWEAPDAPNYPYDGVWLNSGEFLRFDAHFVGLLNPPGPLALIDVKYAPYQYGPNPLFGYIELDVDQNVNSGGEVSFTEHRYLANAARFGGKPAVLRYMNRFATEGVHLDRIIFTPPYVERSGEEFHLALLGDHILQHFEVLGNGDTMFDANETWIIRGPLLHRAHCFEQFSSAGGNGVYQPVVDLRWQHQSAGDVTTLTLVYPLTNAASARLRGDPAIEPMDGNAGNQNSIEEALTDLMATVQAIPQGDPRRLSPAFPLIAPWENQVPSTYLGAESWDDTLLVGMAYPVPQPSGALFAWTDCQPGPLIGDFDGNGRLNPNDSGMLNNYIAAKDGGPEDADGLINGSVRLPDFGSNFSVFDVNYDGAVNVQDKMAVVVPGDANGDFAVDMLDVAIFVQTAVLPSGQQPGPPTMNLYLRADFNQNGMIDGGDTQKFVEALLAYVP